MKSGRFSRRIRRLIVFAMGWLIALSGVLWSTDGFAQSEEPIAYIGHGAFFDARGKEIEVTQAFVAKAQAWYRANLMAGLDERKKRELTELEQRLQKGLRMEGQTRLVVQQRTLEWMFANSSRHQDDHRTLGKLRALTYALTRELPVQAGQRIEKRRPFKLDPDIAKRLDAESLRPNRGIKLLSATINTGQAYINECIAARVPIPPPIGVMDPAGTNGWKSQGFIPIPEQFIGQNNGPSPAEVRTYQSTSPRGMCYALPRYTDTTQTTVGLDGVICLSEETSKVCFWDNQMLGDGFEFAAGDQIPIGVPDLAIDPAGRYQAGGFELLGGSGGICTDCHAGENPYITHPKSDLGGGTLWETLQSVQALPTFSPNRYDPLVPAAWPQNQLSQAGTTVPAVCGSCHVKGFRGRFPHLSNELPGYCGTVLTQAYLRTMPPPPPGTNPGSEVAAAQAFKNAWCNAAPDASAADAGDPHLTTTNGVRYDFQSAGEFVALKNSDTGFELQTRQSPVQTSFTPPPNAHTGLASCVSLNTAVAMRVGKHRVTYQPRAFSELSAELLELRIDGSLVTAIGTPIALSAGNSVTRASDGVLDVRVADGTIVTVTPRFWTSQGYWYLDVDVRKTPAREGTMGPVLAGDWLPRAPDGASFGAKPAALAARHVVLNQKFANAWRVSNTTTLFDYAVGTSTANFTDVNWPPESGKPCLTTLSSRPPLKRMQPELAKTACRGIKDEGLLANCLFDVTVMGDAEVAKGYLRADKLKANNGAP